MEYPFFILFQMDGYFVCCLRRVSLFVLLIVLVCNFPAFIKQVRETTKIFRQAWERSGNASEMDEGAALKLTILVLASATRALLLRNVRCFNMA